jgi:hypothetical protein
MPRIIGGARLRTFPKRETSSDADRGDFLIGRPRRRKHRSYAPGMSMMTLLSQN